jgi:hypothetical protein
MAEDFYLILLFFREKNSFLYVFFALMTALNHFRYLVSRLDNIMQTGEVWKRRGRRTPASDSRNVEKIKRWQTGV